MIRGTVLASIAALALFAVSTTAIAAPDNKNTDSTPVDCEGLGPITITENVRGGENENARGGVGFTDGQVLVVKGFSGTSELTVAIEGGPTFELTDSFEQAVPGKGFESKLIACTLTEEFTEEHTLDEELLAFLEEATGQQLDEFLSDKVSITGTFTGTAQVLAPPSN